jgi:hypothetical protein
MQITKESKGEEITMKRRIVVSLERAGVSPEQVKNVLADLACVFFDTAMPMRCEMGDCGEWLREEAYELYFSEIHKCHKADIRGEPFTVPSQNSSARIGRRETDGKWILTFSGKPSAFLGINACPFCGDALVLTAKVESGSAHESPER